MSSGHNSTQKLFIIFLLFYFATSNTHTHTHTHTHSQLYRIPCAATPRGIINSNNNLSHCEVHKLIKNMLLFTGIVVDMGTVALHVWGMGMGTICL